ncbi:MAG: serine/threonine-protein kinase [Vicinamibacteraceae bacterium]
MTRLADGAIARLRDAATWPALPPDRYEIRRPLGRGGMGTVYAAYDRRLEREVAIKVSNAPAPSSDLETRLRQESRVLAHLEHPGIVPVHDAGALDDGRWFYVMKYVRGETLPEHAVSLAGEAAALAVFERIAEAVAFAHAAGVVHRDLKPSNIMVGAFGEVLVLDWGAAKILAAPAAAPESSTETLESSGGTASGTRIGTPGFMAPEQQRGDASTAGPAADVYSLGAVAFWLLTGEPAPASVDAATRGLAALQPKPSRRLRAIVARCLAEAPVDRYVDASALAADLARYRAGEAVLAHPESASERVVRFLDRYRAVILLMTAYLVMRALFAWAQRR